MPLMCPGRAWDKAGAGPQKTPLFIFAVPVLLCEEAPRGEARPLGCLCVSGGACEWPSLVWSPQHFGGKSGQLTPAVCRFAECGVCRPQAPFGWIMCCSDPPERWPEECALLGPRISYLWLVGHAAGGGEENWVSGQGCREAGEQARPCVFASATP
ncbi:hypothetical protein mRhiFer1_009989 [Rhinolophus ferrumequinum]|uniref:Uncharacterized protein n=1 Tax=Rhinolophus ferrumequinum TaxID=59479 RepID=A0A7J7Y5V9_RHIFE|nr:hypothetical protein mRhiFer1_009989 [Rhinolophus ferrumequinum]